MSDVIELVRGLDSMLDHMRAAYAKWSKLGADLVLYKLMIERNPNERNL